MFSQADVIEPALTEIQRLEFERQTFVNAGITSVIELYYEDAPDRVVSFSLGDVGDSFFEDSPSANSYFDDLESLVANSVVQLRDEVTSADQVEVSVGSAIYDLDLLSFEINYSDPQYINADLPQLVARFSEGETEYLVDSVSLNVLNEDGSFNRQLVESSFELLSRNAENLPIFGLLRDGLFESVRFNEVDLDAFRLLQASGGIRFPSGVIPNYDSSIAYDVLSISVRAIQPASNVQVELAVSEIPLFPGEAVLLYGTPGGEESVPPEQVRLGASSRFSLDVVAPLQAVPDALDVPGNTTTRLPVGKLIANPMDVDGSGSVSAVDMLQIVNEINRPAVAEGEAVAADSLAGTGFSRFDVNQDGEVSALDALMVINYLNDAATLPQAAAAEDIVFNELGPDDDRSYFWIDQAVDSLGLF